MHEQLIQAAEKARNNAYVPYSHFPVGAAVISASGRIFTGCNIENASFGLTVCAERTAIFQAVAAGETSLTTLTVIADTPGPTAPCGACRQVMAEFQVEKVIMANTKGDRKIMELSDLLPNSFSSNDIRS